MLGRVEAEDGQVDGLEEGVPLAVDGPARGAARPGADPVAAIAHHLLARGRRRDDHDAAAARGGLRPLPQPAVDAVPVVAPRSVQQPKHRVTGQRECPPSPLHQREATTQTQVPDHVHRLPLPVRLAEDESSSRRTGPSRSGGVLGENPLVQQRLDRVVLADGTAVSYASVGRPAAGLRDGLAHASPAGLGAAGRAGALRGAGAGLPAGALRPRRVRVVAATDRPASLAFELEQLAAVAATLDEPFDLMGTSMGASVAVAWAAAHPETVRRLVLYGGWVRGAELSPPGVRDHVLGLVESHWGLGSDVLTDIFAPDADRATAPASPGTSAPARAPRPPGNCWR